MFTKSHFSFTERICSKHFEDNAFKTPPITYNYSPNAPYNKRVLKNDAIPTMCLFEEKVEDCASGIAGKFPNELCSEEQHQDPGPEIHLQENNQLRLDNVTSNNNDNNIITDNIENQYNLQQAYINLKKQTKATEIARANYLLYSETYKDKLKAYEEANENLKRENVEYKRKLINISEDYVKVKKLALEHKTAIHEYGKRLKLAEKEAKSAKKQLEVVQKVNETYEKRIKKLEESEKKFKNALEKVFSPGQIKLLLNPHLTRIQWSAVDIAGAISLRAVSPRGYRYLRQNAGFPLPSFSILRKWAQKLALDEGILTSVLDIMEAKGQSMTSVDKICHLAFDELYISNLMAIDSKEEQVIGPHKTCQFVMARGLFSKWKQPVYYKYDQPMTPEIFLDIITQLYKRGYRVASVASDLGSSNQTLLRKMNVFFGNEKQGNSDKKEPPKCYFLHPCNKNWRVYFFADPPHMIKLLRNHLLDHGFTYKQQQITRDCFDKLLELNDKTDLTVAFKLKSEHLICQGTRRQKVSLATQLFSHTNASAIQACGEKRVLGFENWKIIVPVVELINNWFDLFNSRNKYNHTNHGNDAFGVSFDEQCEILNKMKEFMVEMRVVGHKTMLPFQVGIAFNCDSLVGLLTHLQMTASTDEQPIHYLLTNRLNQDVLENTFSYFRGMGATHDHPNALELKSRIRWYILGKYSTDFFSIHANTDTDKSDTDTSLITSQDFNSVAQDGSLKAVRKSRVLEVCDENEIQDEDQLLLEDWTNGLKHHTDDDPDFEEKDDDFSRLNRQGQTVVIEVDGLEQIEQDKGLDCLAMNFTINEEDEDGILQLLQVSDEDKQNEAIALEHLQVERDEEQNEFVGLEVLEPSGHEENEGLQ